MKPEWKDFLLQAGAEFDGERVMHFGNPQRENSVVVTGDTLCDLSHHGLISAHGEDAEAFLQGQLSLDVTDISEPVSHLGSYCTPKGRMLAVFRMFRRGEALYMRLPRETVEATLKRLSMFILRAKVTLEDADDALVRLGLSGPNACAELKTALGIDPPMTADTVVRHDSYSIIRIPGLHDRFEIYGDLEPMTQLWQKLNVRCAPVGAPYWGLLDIMAGIPQIYPQTAEAFVPQMANMELLGAVNFNKGCYPGQEVVARSHYLGKLKRRMYRLALPIDAAPEPNTPLFDAKNDPNQPAGFIVEAQPHPDGGLQALAVLKIASAESGDLHLGSAEGPAASVLSLPYSLEAAKAG